MKRRDFTQMMLTLPLVFGAMSKAESLQRGGGKIIVIGAGASGLAAAQTLVAAGYTVQVLEGRDRIGGRTWTSQYWADAPLDMGASWIHGVEKNPISALADKFGAKRVHTDEENVIVYGPNGQTLSDDRVESLEERCEKILKRARKEADKSDDDISLQDAIAATLNLKSLSKEERQQLDFYINNAIEQDYAGAASELSAHYYDDQGELDGGDEMFVDGYKTIVDGLAKGLDIKLKQVVKQISYGRGGVTVTTSQGTFTADKVVVTLPLGVLKKNAVQFVPPLPEQKKTAISLLGMGVLDKLYLRFPKVFWPTKYDWLGYIDEQKGRWSGWVNCYKLTKQPILLGFNSADFAKETEKWSDKDIINSGMAVLKKIYGNSIPAPTDAQITRWAADPFTFGSYSFMGVGASPKTHEQMAKPVGDTLFFAGEATHKVHPGTVHGAYLSGLRAAREIIG